MNVFGDKWTFTSFGESHGAAIGGVLDGVPAGLHISMDLIREELERRAGKTENKSYIVNSVNRKYIVSPRALREPDEVEWLSGVITPSLEGREGEGLLTLGTPIAFIIRNKDARPEDYEWLKHTYRTGHADKVYEQKYGIRDWRGGGRASARETAARVVAGCIAKQELAAKGISIHASLIQVGAETDPDKFAETIAAYQRDGDSIGGIVECTINGLPVGTGEPIFNKLQAELAFAVMSINACKGFEYGTGFSGVTQPGSAINALSGGIAGGISDGTPITFRCVFKPTPSTPKAGVKGRHDACVATRAVPVVEAMTALALVNLLD
ncbi:MAG: chorismate synthase [Paludibacteraceae bacterium]|nr:chorismate synthase [Paludibacteraceae bacterium]MBQ9295824.1 chorismate synthase [Paludibacteraceae bacterium]